MDSELDAARQWYEAFIETTELAVYMEPSPNQVDLSCGSGSIRIIFSEKEYTVTCNTDTFMNAVATALRAWIIEQQSNDTGKGISLALVLRQFGCLTTQYADLLVSTMDNRDSRSSSDADDYCYDEDEDGGSQVLGNNATTSSSSHLSRFMAERAMTKRWEQKELQLREGRRLQQVQKERQLYLSQSKRCKSEDNDIPANGSGSSSSGSSMSVSIDMDIAQPRSATSAANIFSDVASSIVLKNDLLALMHSPVDLGYTVAPVDDNIYTWAVSIYGFHPSSDIFSDLAMLDSAYGYHHVEIQLTFAMDLFPFYPPLVTIIRPRFKGYMLGRIANLPCLKLSHWDPLIGVQRCIDNIRRVLERNGRLEVNNALNSLSRDSSYIPLEHLLLKLGLVCEVPMRLQGWAVEKQEELEEQEEQENKVQDDAVTSEPACIAPGGLSTNINSNATPNPKPSFPEKKNVTGLLEKGKVKAKGSAVWAKGTGYGSFRNTASNWDVDAFAAAQAEKNRLQSELLEMVLEKIKSTVEQESKAASKAQTQGTESEADRRNVQQDTLISLQTTFEVLAESCILPFLYIYTISDSMVELERHITMYVRAFNVIEYLASVDALQPLLFLPIISHSGATPTNIVSVSVTLATRLRACLQALEKSGAMQSSDVSQLVKTVHPEGSSSAKRARSVHDESSAATVSSAASLPLSDMALNELRTAATNRIKTSNSSGDNVACLQYILQVLQRLEEIKTGGFRAGACCAVNCKCLLCENNSGSQSLESIKAAAYESIMRDGQYEEVEQLPNYHYANEIQSSAYSSGTSRERNKRLAQEHVDLGHSLPLSLSSTVWIRASAERMDILQAMISGPEETPYSNGLFIFDAKFPVDYPTKAPRVNLQTTGAGSVRFNPNLYNCGKVCLSLLGTWSGQSAENWSTQSTFLQVLVSIQSLILVPEPYYNEPGYEEEMHTSRGRIKSRAYNKTIREATIMWGMLDHLRKPSLAFESVIRNHFSFKKEEIMRQIERWCRDDEQFEDGEEEHGREEEENAKEKEEEEVNTSKTSEKSGGVGAMDTSGLEVKEKGKGKQTQINASEHLEDLGACTVVSSSLAASNTSGKLKVPYSAANRPGQRQSKSKLRSLQAEMLKELAKL